MPGRDSPRSPGAAWLDAMGKNPARSSRPSAERRRGLYPADHGDAMGETGDEGRDGVPALALLAVLFAGGEAQRVRSVAGRGHRGDVAALADGGQRRLVDRLDGALQRLLRAGAELHLFA